MVHLETIKTCKAECFFFLVCVFVTYMNAGVFRKLKKRGGGEQREKIRKLKEGSEGKQKRNRENLDVDNYVKLAM